jgi:hypothetical protein
LLPSLIVAGKSYGYDGPFLGFLFSSLQAEGRLERQAAAREREREREKKNTESRRWRHQQEE